MHQLINAGNGMVELMLGRESFLCTSTSMMKCNLCKVYKEQESVGEILMTGIQSST